MKEVAVRVEERTEDSFGGGLKVLLPSHRQVSE